MLPSDPDLPILPRLRPATAPPRLIAAGRLVIAARALVVAARPAVAERVALLNTLEAILADGAAAAAVADHAFGRAEGDWPAAAAAIAAARALGREDTGPRPHLRHFLQACRREAGGWRPATWSEVIVHGRFAAASLAHDGLKAIAGGDDDDAAGGLPAAGERALEALAIAVWLLRQVRAIDPLAPPPPCIPARFFSDAMITPGHLRLAAARGQVRAVLDRVLDGVDHLLLEAAPLPAYLPTAALARHAAVLGCRGRALAARLRHRDPLLQPVRLAAWQRHRCAVLAAIGQAGIGRRPGR